MKPCGLGVSETPPREPTAEELIKALNAAEEAIRKHCGWGFPAVPMFDYGSAYWQLGDFLGSAARAVRFHDDETVARNAYTDGGDAAGEFCEVALITHRGAPSAVSRGKELALLHVESGGEQYLMIVRIDREVKGP